MAFAKENTSTNKPRQGPESMIPQPIVVKTLEEIEKATMDVAESFQERVEELQSAFSQISNATVQTMEIALDAASKCSSDADHAISQGYQLIEDCKTLSSSIQPAKQLADDIARINRDLDEFEVLLDKMQVVQRDRPSSSVYQIGGLQFFGLD